MDTGGPMQDQVPDSFWRDVVAQLGLREQQL